MVLIFNSYSSFIVHNPDSINYTHSSADRKLRIDAPRRARTFNSDFSYFCALSTSHVSFCLTYSFSTEAAGGLIFDEDRQTYIVTGNDATAISRFANRGGSPLRVSSSIMNLIG